MNMQGGRGGFTGGGDMQGHLNPAFMQGSAGSGQFQGPDGPRKKFRQEGEY
jgi:hypothetical protein